MFNVAIVMLGISFIIHGAWEGEWDFVHAGLLLWILGVCINTSQKES